MTYYLMFQFTFMVLGTLYATWRVLAIVSILLFAVAALDRSLLPIFKVGDVASDAVAQAAAVPAVAQAAAVPAVAQAHKL
jgi:hypothetical protein